LALFQSNEPMIARTPITTIAPISRIMLVVDQSLCFHVQKPATTSTAMAANHSSSALMRYLVALDFASGVGFQVGSLARLSGVDSTRTTFLRRSSSLVGFLGESRARVGRK
jgi:2-oxoglutarate dehydrogenase complex dehydrogenase (E1) component-like enzyme